LSATGLPGHEPVKSGIPIADLGAGLFATYGILSALLGRAQSGRGQYIDASLLEAALGLSVWETTELWGTGKSPQPIGSANRMSAPYQAVQASDGYFVIGAANQKLWLTFLEVVQRPELSSDPRFASNALRVTNRIELIEALKPRFAQRTVHEWVEALLAAGVPAGPIYNYEQALASDHIAAREMVIDVPHPVEGSFRALGFPIKMTGTPQRVRHSPPLLDQHGDEIRRELIEKGLLPATEQQAVSR
jgi:crotonobetainyl-CoA:carnitine CoA-transferase CaiB-like acyl-CoA transferase